MTRFLRGLTYGIVFWTIILVFISRAQAVTMCPALPHNTLPTQDSNFVSNLQTFLCQEEPDQYVEQFHDFVFSGGFVDPPAPAAGLSITPGSPTIATIEGFYVHDALSVPLTNNAECWMVMDVETTGNLGTFMRGGSTHYLADCRPYHSSKPALPSGTVWLMWVKTGGGSVIETLDLRTRVPWGRTVQLTGELPSSDRRVDLAYSQEDGCFYGDTGEGWTAFWDARFAQLVTMTFPYDPPNLASGAFRCDIFSFPGVQVDFRCLATQYDPNIQTAGLNAGSILMNASVQASDVVRVCYENLSASSIDANDGFMKVSCWR